jgi:hypothetical protein
LLLSLHEARNVSNTSPKETESVIKASAIIPNKPASRKFRFVVASDRAVSDAIPTKAHARKPMFLQMSAGEAGFWDEPKQLQGTWSLLIRTVSRAMQKTDRRRIAVRKPAKRRGLPP